MRKRLVEADGCILAQEVDAFPARGSERRFNKHVADATTAETGVDGDTREECLELAVAEQFREPDDFALDHSHDGCDTWCGEEAQRAYGVVRQGRPAFRHAKREHPIEMFGTERMVSIPASLAAAAKGFPMSA